MNRRKNTSCPTGYTHLAPDLFRHAKGLMRAAIIGAGMVATVVSAQTLEIATDTSPAGLDPHIVPAFSSTMITGNIYEGLTFIDRSLVPAPLLATSWTVSADGKTYRFKLKRGVKFHNGKEMTADDVVASYKRVLDPKTSSPYATRFNMVKSVTADGGDVVFALEEPSAPFLGQLSSVAILPADLIAKGGDFQRAPVGTGPFMFDRWVTDAYVSLTKFPGYHEAGLPKLAGLKFNIVPESSTREAGVAGGTYQFLPVVDSISALSLQSKPGVSMLRTADLSYSLVGMNTSKPPFDNEKVRQALNYALDRDEIVKAVYVGRAVVATPVPAALSQWAVGRSEFACYQHSADKARELLKQAGVAMPLPITINVLPQQVTTDTAQVVQAQLEKAGFKVTLNVQEIGKFVADWRASNFSAFISLNAGGIDPDDYFYRAFRSGGSANVFKYANPALDEALDKARTITAPAERKKIYTQIQKDIACGGPVAFIASGELVTAMRGEVKGYTTLGTRGLTYLKETTLSK